jgi:hypothetical protein
LPRYEQRQLDDELPARAFERPKRAEPPRTPDRPARLPEPRAIEPRAEAPGRSSLDDMFGPKEADLDVFNLDSPENAPRPRDVGDRGPVLEYEAAEESDLSLDRELDQAHGGEAAESQRGPADEEDGQRRRRRRRGRGRRGRGADREPAQSEQTRPPLGQPDLDFDPDLDRDLDLELDAELLGDEDSSFGRAAPASVPEGRGSEARRPEGRGAERGERGPRGERGRETARGERGPARQHEADRDREPQRDQEGGRHRGRRGRGRGRDGEERIEGRTSAAGASQEGESRYGQRRAPQPPPARHDDETDDLDLHLEHDEGDEETGAGAPTHKKIPTWDEAVGLLIDANMASRANSPERDRGRGGRGRGRGGYGRGR